MFIHSTTRGLALALALAAPAFAAAQQQPHDGHAHGTPSAAAPPAAKPQVQSRRDGGYRSAFDGYRRFEDAPPVPWREANDGVGRIGGWRAYAREAAGATPAAGTASQAGHGAHHKP